MYCSAVVVATHLCSWVEGEGPSTSRNVEEEAIMDSDSDEEAVAYRQALENKIKETKQQINATNDLNTYTRVGRSRG